MGPSSNLDFPGDLASDVMGSRSPERPVPSIFLSRWSPRSFLPDPIPNEDLMGCFEAARWAPSSFNEQPWRFLYAASEEDRKNFLACLALFNRAWASRAPVLVALCAKEAFRRDGSANACCDLDAGAAWMSFSLEARRRGYHTHGMAGFLKDETVRLLRVPDGFHVRCFIAVGKRGPVEALPESDREREVPSPRKPLEEIALEGGFPP